MNPFARSAVVRLAAACLALAVALPCLAQGAAAKPATGKAEPATAPVDATFAAWDRDHDKALSLDEFRNGWAVMRRGLEIEARLRRQFNTVDANHDGAIDAGEYPNLVLIRQAGKKAPALSAFDANKDQRLQFGEYVDLVRKLAPSHPAAAK